MSRCAYDGVFYRVFCVTLLAIALAFIVILTNVFVDIDGLLSNKKSEKLYSDDATQNDIDAIFQPDTKSEPYYHDDKSYDDTEYGYRTKRSLESQNFIFRIKSPKVKNILKNRLATLLDDLDEEESENVVKNGRNDKFDTFDMNEDGNSVDDKNDKVVTRTDIHKHDNIESKFIQNDNMMNTAIHNSILQGIVRNVDIHEIYNKVQALTSSNMDNLEPKVGAPKPRIDEAKKPTEKINTSQSTEEKRLINELVKFNKLDKPKDGAENKITPDMSKGVTHKGPKLLIQTVIDIRSQTEDKKRTGNANSTNPKEDIKGIIKLIYNGKSIKFSQMDDEVTTLPTNKETTVTPTRDLTTEKVKSKIEETDTLDNKYTHLPKGFLKKIISEYFANNNKDLLVSENLKVQAKRLKRHVKIRYETDDNSKHQKHSNKTKTDDDELFVEIETHLDSKGMKGDKKKKLIKNLIEKIQKAIHEPTVTKKKSKAHKTIHVKKRTQNPLDHKERLDKVSVRQSVIHRHLDPISKIANERDPITAMYDKTGESWKKKFSGPGFLTHTKRLNSAEMSEVEIDYAINTANSEIPQRYQKPLNSETNDDDNPNNFYDLGNMKFFLKDIDGTGFSIGINQFVDEPPDSESIKLFTGLENIIQTYHQKYDPNDPIEVNPYPERMSLNQYSNYNASSEHVIARRSVSENDYHTNAYKIIYDKDFLAYKNNEDIFKDMKKNVDKTGVRKHKIDETVFERVNHPSFAVDENFLSKHLKPAEIIGLTNLLDRKKRSITVKKISNLSKLKINKLINTKPLVTKHYFNRRRNKRQIDKIRIIASEIPSSYKHSKELFISGIPHEHTHSEEVFVVSDEHVFADRAIVREVPTPEEKYSVKELEHNDKIEEHYDLISPYVYDEQSQPYTYMTNIFDNKARHNALMSKYPHIFMEEISRSKEEELIPEIPLVNLTSRRHYSTIQREEPTPSNTSAIEDQEMPPLDEIVNAISPDPHPKANYKVTVKILPKNSTDMNGGFKEVHTSINKSFNKNGLLYSSLVNVSEISKITKINKTQLNTAPTTTTVSPIVKKLKQEQDRVQEVLKRHMERIDEQLLHLNNEKHKLETMIRNKTHITANQSKDEFVDLILSSDPPKVIRLRKKDVDKLAASALKAQDFTTPSIIASNSATSPITISTSTTTTPHPDTTTNRPPIKMTTQKSKPATTKAMKELDKFTIMNKIEKNDNLTYEILQKIDKNTQILQQFLLKVSERLQPTTTPATRRNLELPNPKPAINTPLDWKKFQPPHDPFFTETLPNLEVYKNDTHVSIPFIYAYQQPFHLPDPKLKTPVASVVYHGHIHTNVNKDEYLKSHAKVNEIDKPKVEGSMKDNDRSRFFMDGPENEVMPVGAKKNDKPLYVKHVATTNSTIH